MLLLLLIAAAPRAAHGDAPKPPAVEVPFELLPTKHIAIMVKVNGKGPYRVLFDTGAPVTVLSSKVGHEAGVLPKDAPMPGGLLGGLGQHPIETLAIGDLKAEKVPAIVMDHPAVTALAKNHGPLEGIVGFPFFARYRMTLDYQAKKLTFLPGDYEPDDVLQALMIAITKRQKTGARILAPGALWGFSVRKDADDEAAGVAVTAVRAGSAVAQAGLQPGDRLLTLDGRWTDSVADCYVAAGFVKAGTAVELVVRRDGKDKKLMVTPRPGL